MFSLDYYKIVRVPTSRGRDAIFIGIFTAGAHENIFLGEESSPLVTSPFPWLRFVFRLVRSHPILVLARIHHASSNRILPHKFVSPGCVHASNDRRDHNRASISSRRKGLDELPIRASFMDHRGDGIKIDTTAWESPRPREGGRFITGNTPSLHPYPISLSSVGDDCQRFHCGREKGKKTMEVYVYVYTCTYTRNVARFRWKICTGECVSRWRGDVFPEMAVSLSF